MGATSGYHPISLHVIRGAAEYCGFKLGRIRRIASLPAEGKAVYNVEIEHAPQGWQGWSTKTYRHQLQHCFMDDIKVADVRMRFVGHTAATLVVQLSSSPLDAMLEKLVDKNENE